MLRGGGGVVASRLVPRGPGMTGFRHETLKDGAVRQCQGRTTGYLLANIYLWLSFLHGSGGLRSCVDSPILWVIGTECM